ncbi:hypothetical protein DFS34DRAFT_196564 [Phlyctochytrium arcticum]|nr:hypothetical protein DFS34DRAFT_196564 [Phlyctochytrium arcticum]
MGTHSQCLPTAPRDPRLPSEVFLGFHVLTLIVGPIVANFEKYTKYAVLATLGFHVSQSLVLGTLLDSRFVFGRMAIAGYNLMFFRPGTNFFRAGEMLIAVSAVLTYLYPRDMPRYAAHA